MNETEAIARRLLDWREGSTGPTTLEIQPTMACNLRCVFCEEATRRGPAPDELPTERWLTLLDEAAALGLSRVFVLGGGEPMAAPAKCLAILRRAKALGLEGILGTNGTLFTEATIRELVEIGWDEIHFSVDGPTADIHDALRGTPGAFKRTIQSLCRFQGLKARLGLERPRLVMHFVVTNTNAHTLGDMLRLASGLGVRRVDFDALVTWTDTQRRLALDGAGRALLQEEARRAEVLALELGIESSVGHLRAAETLRRGERKLPEGLPLLPVVGRAPCLKAWHDLVVQPDGRSSPCCVLAGIGASVRHASLAEVWFRGASLREIRASMREGKPLARCVECSTNILAHEEAIRAAMGAARAAGGDRLWP
jgi:MoaA/NifB/PqqE/SkfB family radical SAM enzyme